MKLLSKIILTGKLELITGLHIGGSKSSMEIGGIDSPVIKTANKVPYIPGSSLKGKLRSLLAKEEGSIDVNRDSDKLKMIFGSSDRNFVTRLFVRDAYLDEDAFKIFQDIDSIINYGEEKVENVIDRRTGAAKNPRHIERVPAGTIFNFEMLLNKYENDPDFYQDIKMALNLLEDDYLGGSGSRGYGKVAIIELNKVEKKIEDYKEVV